VIGQHCLLAEEDIGAPIYWRTDVPPPVLLADRLVSHLLLADRTKEVKKEADQTVWCTSHIFKPIASLLSFTNRKRKYVEEKTTATLKIKQTLIATVRNHILTVACFLTILPFHYPLPLIKPAISSGHIVLQYPNNSLLPS
jgi:hypothetical protein